MQSKVIFHDGSDIDPTDHTRLQDFAQGALDDVVGDVVTPAQRYAGFVVTKTGPTTIRVAPGRLYSAGKVYARKGEQPFDFLSSLPIAGKKIVAVVVFGTEQDTDTRPREFLINEETGASEPRVVAMERARIANITTAAGAEAPDPTPPLVDVGYTIIAYVLLTPTGVDAVTMIDNRVPNVGEMHLKLKSIDDWKQATDPALSTLGSDLARMANQMAQGATSGLLGRILLRLAAAEAKAGVPVNAADSAADFFLDRTKTDTAHAALLVKVSEGLRFAADNENETPLAIFDPLNPRAVVRNGMLLPAYDREPWLSSGTNRTGETQIASYTYTTHEMVQRTVSRQRTRYGEEFIELADADWWSSGSYDWFTGIYTREGETYNIGWATDVTGSYDHRRMRKFWTDTYEEPYWEAVTVSHSVGGAQVAETWLQGQDVWCDAIGLYFTRLAAAGAVHVTLCEVSAHGLPLLDKTIAVATVDRNAMVLNGETLVGIAPTYLQAGKRYAVVLTTAADHWVAMINGNDFKQGTFFYVLDGAYAQGDGTRDLMFRLHRCKFRAARAAIELTALQLAGGILSIDILAGTIVPASTTLSYEIQVAGEWHPLSDVQGYVLGQGGNIPPLLPLRVAFVGSVDMMPALHLADSRVKVSRPRTVFRHISTARALPAPSSQIRVLFKLTAFVAAFHAATCRLLTGAGHATEVLPNSTSDVVQADGTIERTAVFNLAAPVTSYKIDLRGTTTTAQKVFVLGARRDYAL